MRRAMTRWQQLYWYFHRLRSMSPPEWRWRLAGRRLVAHERAWAAAGSTAPRLTDAQQTRWYETFIQAEGYRFFFMAEEAPALRRQLREHFPLAVQSTVRQAESLLSGVITLFQQTLPLDDPVQWGRDPRTRRDWPAIFYADIDIRDSATVGGVKWVWELNRHHHLVTLGKAYFLTDDERYARAVVAQLDSWLAANPPLIGVNWTSALELAVRLLNWLWALHLIRPVSALTPTLFGRIMQSMQAQAAYIERHLSAFSSANNHLVGEAAGLAGVGLCCHWLPEAASWRAQGLAILEREIGLQITEDGVSAEQAMAYLAFVLDFNLHTWQLAHLNGHTLPAIWPARLRAAADFMRHCLDEGGHLPTIGDSDDAWVVRSDDRPEANNYHALLASAAAILAEPAFKTGITWDEKSHWLLGAAGRAAFEALPEVVEAALPSRLFAVGGYAVMRAPGRIAVADVGPLGYLSLAAHGHADALSLWLSLAGRPMLVDPGAYAYQEGGAWRRYLRSTAAHNTVVVDGQDQSVMLGVFLWGRQATTRVLHWQSAPAYDCLVAEHDGYASRGVTHRRHWLFYKPDWLLVVDVLSGHRAHRVEQWWHFPPDCEIRVESDTILAQTDTTRLALWCWGSADTQAHLSLGEMAPLQGWFSPGYGVITPAPAVSFGGMLSLPATLGVLVRLGDWPDRQSLMQHQSLCTQLLKTAWEEVAI